MTVCILQRGSETRKGQRDQGQHAQRHKASGQAGGAPPPRSQGLSTSPLLGKPTTEDSSELSVFLGDMNNKLIILWNGHCLSFPANKTSSYRVAPPESSDAHKPLLPYDQGNLFLPECSYKYAVRARQHTCLTAKHQKENPLCIQNNLSGGSNI